MHDGGALRRQDQVEVAQAQAEDTIALDRMADDLRRSAAADRQEFSGETRNIGLRGMPSAAWVRPRISPTAPPAS